jgi:hypothetical protein
MKKIYIDSDYKCHAANDGTMTSVETDAFDGKCDAFIEGYRLIPAGETWTRSDGKVFDGEMVSPWENYAILDAFQQQYERDAAEREDMVAALNEMEVYA